jgi:hypothetical protein
MYIETTIFIGKEIISSVQGYMEEIKIVITVI